MAKTQFNVEQFKTEAEKPLFAVAGATELAVELARGYATEAQKATQERINEVQTRVSDVQARVAKVDLEPKTLQAQARTRVEELQAEAKDAQAHFEARADRPPEGRPGLPGQVRGPAQRGPRGAEHAPTPTSRCVVRSSSPRSARTASRRSPRKPAAAQGRHEGPAKKTTAKPAAKKAPAKKATKKAS